MKKFIFIKIAFSLLIGSLLLQFVFRENPLLAKRFYKDGLFAFIRSSYDTCIGQWLPIPFLWIALILLIGSMLFHMSKKKKIWNKLFTGFAWIALVIVGFYFLWGYNYNVPSVSRLIELKINKVDSTDLYQEMDYVLEQINSFRNNYQNDTFPIAYTPKDMEIEVRKNLKATFDYLHIKTTGKPRVRILKPKGILMRIKTAGIYIPHSFEGHIDGGLLEIEHPFTMAHEMSHAYGIAGEGDCNFLAFLACASSDNPYFQYSAYLDYSLYLLRDVYRTDKEKHRFYRKNLHPGYRADIQEIFKNGDKYPDIFPAVRDFMYDNYLKSQGISDGIKNYSRIIQLVINYREKYPEFLGSSPK